MNANNVSKFSQKFKNLIDFIEGIKPGFLNAVGHGYSINTILSEFPDKKLPDELVAIYLNVGSNNQGRGGFGLSTFIPGFNIIPLLDIKSQLSIYENMHDELLQELGEDDWETDMIPFLEDGCGSHYCVRTLEKDQSIYCLDKVDERSYKCRDLNVFFDMIYEMYREGAYYINEDNELDCKWDLETKIEDKYSCQAS